MQRLLLEVASLMSLILFSFAFGERLRPDFCSPLSSESQLGLVIAGLFSVAVFTIVCTSTA